MLNAAPPWRPACVTPLVIVCHALMSISGICNTCFQLVNQYIRVLSCTPQLPDCLDLVFIFSQTLRLSSCSYYFSCVSSDSLCMTLCFFASRLSGLFDFADYLKVNNHHLIFLLKIHPALGSSASGRCIN